MSKIPRFQLFSGFVDKTYLAIAHFHLLWNIKVCVTAELFSLCKRVEETTLQVCTGLSTAPSYLNLSHGYSYPSPQV